MENLHFSRPDPHRDSSRALLTLLLITTLHFCGAHVASAAVSTHSIRYLHAKEDVSGTDSTGAAIGFWTNQEVAFRNGKWVGTNTVHQKYGYDYAILYGVEWNRNIYRYPLSGTSSRTTTNSTGYSYTTSPAPAYSPLGAKNVHTTYSWGGHMKHITTAYLDAHGPSGSTQKNFYKVTVSAQDAATGTQIPKTSIQIAGNWCNSNGEVYLAVADNSDRDITPAIPGYNNYVFSLGAVQAKPQIKLGSTDISNQTNTTVVGSRRILLATTSISMPITGWNWSVPGSRVADFQISSNQTVGQKVELTALNTSTVSFVWTDAGPNLAVTCDLTIGGEVASVSTVYNVLKPGTSIAVTESSVGVVAGIQVDALQYGIIPTDEYSPVDPGIKFVTSYTNPPGFSGNYQYWQVVDSTVRKKKNQFGQLLQFSAAKVLDAAPYWDDGIGMTHDSPSQAVQYGDYVYADDALTMYLMYRPIGGSGNIFVPLKKVSWTWGGEAIYTNSSWNLTTSPDQRSHVDAVDTSEHPEWTNIVKTLSDAPSNWIILP